MGGGGTAFYFYNVRAKSDINQTRNFENLLTRQSCRYISVVITIT